MGADSILYIIVVESIKMRRRGIFFIILILQGMTLFPLAAQEFSGGQDFGDDFSLSMFTLKELFQQQDDGGQDLKGLMDMTVLGVIVLLAVGVIVAIIVHLVRRRKDSKDSARFRETRAIVLNTKMDSVSGEELSRIIDRGVALSKKVDAHTGRRYAMTLPVLVYDAAIQMGLDKETSVKYFCASLFYDCGLLEIPGELFFGEILTEKEKQTFKKHVLRFEDQISFLPRGIFIEAYNAYCFHHENWNGTGYPEGLMGDEIPLVARILHVVESYLSLRSRGTYHKGLSKKSAIRDLKGRAEIYDPAIIDIIESLV